MALIWNKLIAISVFVAFTRACPNGERRKRSVDLDAPRLDRELADFFGSCPPLKAAARDVFPSLQSNVDYVIRETNWFRDVEKNVCSGDMDVAECWIYALDFLFNEQSIFLEPTADCICRWARTCPDPPDLPHPVSKRDLPERDHDDWYYGPPRIPDKCKPNFKNRPLTPKQKTFTTCFERKIQRFKNEYPSIKRLEGTSITLFVRDHFSFCRKVPVFSYSQRNLFPILYRERFCPSSGRSAAWRKDFIDVFRVATRRDGPLGMTIDPCDPDLQPIYGPWNHWSDCSKTCGGGYQTRRRKCIKPHCTEPLKQSRDCNTKPCPKDPCWPNPCKYGGKCVPVTPDYGQIYTLGSGSRSPSYGGSRQFTCKCRTGYTGNLCEIRDDCKDDYDFCDYWACGIVSDGCKKTCHEC